MNFKNMDIKKRLLTSFIVVAIIAAIVGGIGIFASVSLGNSGELQNARTDEAIDAARVNRLTNEQRAFLRGYAIHITSSYLPELREAELKEAETQLTHIEETAAEAEEYLEDIKRLAKSPKVKEALEIVEEKRAVYATTKEKFINMINETKELDPETSLPLVVDAMNFLRDPLDEYTNSLIELTEVINTLTDEQAESMQNLTTTVLAILIFIIIVAVIVAIALGNYIAKLISVPVLYVSGILSAMGKDGRVQYTSQEWDECNRLAAGKDELAECCENLGLAAKHFGELSETLMTVSKGDLTPLAHSLGNDDIIANATIEILNNLNRMFSDISTATNEVNAGAGQISNASEALSQGATEQASSVEELASTINNISEAVKKSAENAKTASEIAGNTGDIMGTANKKMEEMVSAMENISTASHEISKIIKTIEDIAFQTNILALNASVEAARAGAAGKGFAVVANEVGSLASKSAEASKSTASLIETSVKAVEIGTKIVDDTAKSLIEAVKGSESVVIRIDEISKASELQSDSLTQVTLGVDQISSVVQTNSATAQECAASAQELNAQSNLLSQNVGKFKLKGVSNTDNYSPQPSYSAPRKPVSIDLDKY